MTQSDCLEYTPRGLRDLKAVPKAERDQIRANLESLRVGAMNLDVLPLTGHPGRPLERLRIRDEDMNRRDFLTTMGLAGASLMLPTTAYARAGRVTPHMLRPLSIVGGGYPEVAPCFIGSKTWVSTGYSYVGHIHGGEITCEKMVSWPVLDIPWRRSYAGVFSAVRHNHDELTFLHGENKNTLAADGAEIINTISRDNSGYSGVQADGIYRDCAVDYFAFASMTVNNHDHGPIVWPSKGYLTKTGKQASQGCRHPMSAIIHGRYVYVFYMDTSVGTVVARADLDRLHDGFSTWTGRTWERSLPAAHSFRERLYKRGPQAAPIIGGGILSYCFTVCADGMGGFVGLQQYAPSPTAIRTARWVSRDLVHWRFDGHLPWSGNGDNVDLAWTVLPVQSPRILTPHKAIAVKNGQAAIYAI